MEIRILYFSLICDLIAYIRRLHGEDLGPLSIKELQILEEQLEKALSQARQRKVRVNV